MLFESLPFIDIEQGFIATNQSTDIIWYDTICLFNMHLKKWLKPS